MLLNPATLKHHVAAANRGRYALNTIALMPAGLLSTDGHSLLFVPYPDVDRAEAPKIEGVDPASPPPRVEPFLVSLEDAAKAAAMPGRAKRHAPPITQYIQAQIREDGIAFGVTDLSNAQTMAVRRVDGTFPEVGRVIPEYDKALAISVNLDQFLRTLKALRGVTSDEVVTLRVIDDQQAVGFSCKDGTAALCMPVQVEKPEQHVPDQLARLRMGDDGPPVAAPAHPDEEEEDAEEFVVPSETEMQEAQEVFNTQPAIPEAAPAVESPRPKRKRRRKQAENAEDELQAILSGA